MAVSIALEFCIGVAKVLKLKIGKSWWLIPSFVALFINKNFCRGEIFRSFQKFLISLRKRKLDIIKLKNLNESSEQL